MAERDLSAAAVPAERGPIGRTLDMLYRTAGAISGLCLIAIVTIVALRWGARVFGITFSGGSDYAGYAMATASFMGFAYTLNHAAHIRVTLGLTALGRYRRWGEVWCFSLACVISSWIAWEACIFAWRTFERGYKSAGADATPLWIPQLPMAIGAVLLAVCFWDNLIALFSRGEANVVEPELEEKVEI